MWIANPRADRADTGEPLGTRWIPEVGPGAGTSPIPWVISRAVLIAGGGTPTGAARSARRQDRSWFHLLRLLEQRHRFGAEVAPSHLPLVVLLGEHCAG